jgi:hypothetical protein
MSGEDVYRATADSNRCNSDGLQRPSPFPSPDTTSPSSARTRWPSPRAARAMIANRGGTIIGTPNPIDIHQPRDPIRNIAKTPFTRMASTLRCSRQCIASQPFFAAFHEIRIRPCRTSVGLSSFQGFSGIAATLMKHHASPGWHRISQYQCSRPGSALTRREAPVCSTGTKRSRPGSLRSRRRSALLAGSSRASNDTTALPHGLPPARQQLMRTPVCC